MTLHALLHHAPGRDDGAGEQRIEPEEDVVGRDVGRARGVRLLHQLQMSTDANRRRTGVQHPRRVLPRGDFNRGRLTVGEMEAEDHRVHHRREVVHVGEQHVLHPQRGELLSHSALAQKPVHIAVSGRRPGGRTGCVPVDLEVGRQARKHGLLKEDEGLVGEARSQRRGDACVGQVARHQRHRDRAAEALVGPGRVVQLELEKGPCAQRGNERFDGPAKTRAGAPRDNHEPKLSASQCAFPELEQGSVRRRSRQGELLHVPLPASFHHALRRRGRVSTTEGVHQRGEAGRVELRMVGGQRIEARGHDRTIPAPPGSVNVLKLSRTGGVGHAQIGSRSDARRPGNRGSARTSSRPNPAAWQRSGRCCNWCRRHRGGPQGGVAPCGPLGSQSDEEGDS